MNTHNKAFKTFDPNPSIKLALSLFKEAGIQQFALIGKLAIWVHLKDESQHQFTKDVDFAVLLTDAGRIEKIIKDKKLKYEQLRIGGIGIRENGINIDFIDRRLHGVNKLFSDAISNASHKVSIDNESIPVVSPEYLMAMKLVSGEPKDDNDLRILINIKNLNYENAKNIVTKHLGEITGERLDVFAREAGLLPKRGPYRYGE